MISPHDIKALKRHETRSARIAYWVLMFAPFFLIVMGCLNLWQASIIGNKKGYDIPLLVQRWIEGVNSNQLYSGLYLKAIERLETALHQFALATIFFILFYGYHQRKSMDARILTVLRQAGQITD